MILSLKSGSPKSLPASFRPVSLTSHIAKVLKPIVKNSVLSFLNCNILLSANQHGFRAGRLCLSQLLCHQDMILKALEEGTNVDTVYLDLSKAFNKVNIGILAHCLQGHKRNVQFGGV